MIKPLSKTSGLIGLCICMLLFTCTNDETPEPDNNNSSSLNCDSLSPAYQDDVKAIMDNNCAISGCHIEGNGANDSKGIALETYNKVKDEASKDRFLCAIKHESGCTNMPDGGGQLSSEKINTIECWINNGMPEN